MLDENVKDKLKKILKRNETTTNLSEFNISESILEYVHKSLKHLPNIETLIWPSAHSQEDDLESVKKLKNKVNKRLQTNCNMFKELKQELVKNDPTTDMSQFNGLAFEDTEKFLVYVLKSLEILPNITTLVWPDVCLSLSDKTQLNLKEKIEERLDENQKRNKKKIDKEVERELKKKLKSNETNVDLSEFDIKEEHLTFILDALQSSHLPNIENIKWPSSSQKSNEPLIQQLSEILSKRKANFKEIKEKLAKNENQIDMSEVNAPNGDIKMFLVYVLKSLEKLSNITTIKWPSNCLPHVKEDQHQGIMEKINEKLNLNLKHIEQERGSSVDDREQAREKLTKDLMRRLVPFIGRTQMLEQIKEELKTKQIVVLAANEGTGKSTLANEFAYKYAESRETNDDRVSVLVHCETRDKVFDKLKKIALHLKIDTSKREIVEKLFYHVRCALNELDQTFLFILDNVEMYEDIAEFLKEFSKCEKCKFLMTTRDKNVLRDFEVDKKKCILTLDPFDVDEAKDFVQINLDQIKKLSNTEIVNVISLVIDDEHKILPLKLKLIVNYINDNLVEFACLDDCVEYMRTQSMARRGEFEIETCLFQALSKTKSLNILAFCSYQDADAISLNLIRDLFKPLKEALNKLISLGMLDVDYDKSQITMHRLVQSEMRSFIRNNAHEFLNDSKDEWTKRLVKDLNGSVSKIDRSMVAANNGTELSKKIAREYTHVKEIVNFIDLSEKLQEDFKLNADFIKLKAKLGDYYVYFDAASNQSKALDMCLFVKSSLSEIHKNNDCEDLALSYFKLGRIYSILAKYEEGLAWYKSSYEMRQRLYTNKDHDDLASCLNNMGALCDRLGRYEESLKYRKEYYEMKQRLLKQRDHADLVASLNNIGIAYDHLGNYEESLKYDLLSLEMAQRLHDNNDHAGLANSLYNIGVSYDRLGKYEDSLKYKIDCYEMRKRLYHSKDHADLAQSLNSLSVSYDNLGKYEDGLKYKVEFYEMKQRLFNNIDHADLASYLNDIGVTFGRLGKYEEGLKYKIDCYEMRKRLYHSKDHADLAQSLNSISISYDNLGKYEDGLKYKIDCFEMRKRLYNNKDHADVAQSLNNIGASYGRLGKREESLKWCQESSDMRKRLHAGDHMLLAESLASQELNPTGSDRIYDGNPTGIRT
jgi:energy-coupling factor transporter ATP-binding protein EcfA2